MKVTNNKRWIFAATLTALWLVVAAPSLADTGESTRINDEKQEVCSIRGGYPYREKADYVLKELDLKPGDVVVDIGAGDGFWTEKMAEAVGPKGTVYAAEVDQGKVDHLKQRFANTPQVKPYLCPTDGTGLDENSCDLAFLSKTYHHLDKQVDYLRGLRSVVKPTGRLVVIEMYRELGAGHSREHAWSPGLLTEQAEEAGWILLRYELISGTYHFVSVFAQKELFPIKQPQSRRRPPAAEKEKEPVPAGTSS